MPALPVIVLFRTEQHHRNRRIFGGLNQGEPLEQFIEGAETAGHHHHRVGFAQEKELAGVEVAEIEQLGVALDVGVRRLLKGQLHIEAKGLAGAGAAVGGFHHTGTGTRHHLETAAHGLGSHLHRQGVHRVIFRRTG